MSAFEATPLPSGWPEEVQFAPEIVPRRAGERNWVVTLPDDVFTDAPVPSSNLKKAMAPSFTHSTPVKSSLQV